MSFLRRVAGLSLRDKVRSSDIQRELGVEPLLLRIKRSQLRWFGHLTRMPPGRLPFGGFPGTSDGEETLRQTQNPLERLYISSGLGTPRDPPGGAGERCWGEGGLESPGEPTASATRPRTSGMKMDGWMDGLRFELIDTAIETSGSPSHHARYVTERETPVHFHNSAIMLLVGTF